MRLAPRSSSPWRRRRWPSKRRRPRTKHRGEAGVEAIVVTGTRLRLGGAGPPTPVLRERADDLLRAQPLGIAEALIQLPQFSGSVSPPARARAIRRTGAVIFSICAMLASAGP